MHASGIRVDEELKAAFVKAQENTAYLNIKIKDEVFALDSSATSKGSAEADWAAAATTLQSGVPCYLCVRESSGRWTLALFVPMNSPVRSKMLYASSAAALKNGLGDNQFFSDYHMSNVEECSLSNFLHATKEVEDHEIMTLDEMDAHAAHMEAHMAISDVKTQAIVEMPINMEDAAKAAVSGIGAGKHTTAVLLLDPATEICTLDSAGNESFADVAGKLPAKEPRFIIRKFPHDNEGEKKTANMFIYYCPDGAKPKLKMFYSTVKAVLMKACSTLDVEITKNLEVSKPDEITDEACLDELYPKKHVKKVFSKPKARGKGRAKFRGKGFSAN